MPSSRNHASSSLPGLPLLGLCFFLSGMGSLALEVVWTRQLRLVFGSTTLAASTILVAYMLGLGIGGLVGGRVAGRVRDGVRAYGWIEIAIGGYALLVPWLLRTLPEIDRIVLHGLSFWPAALCRFAIVLLLLLVPTILMGATLPILVATLVRRDPRVGRATGLLYGLNTLGAVAGVFLATFVLFPTLGLARTNAFGALLDAAVGVLALLVVARRIGVASDAAAPAPASEAAGPGRDAVPVAMLLATYATVGFTALLYEVAWTRALAVVLGSSIYAFSSMLGAFLTGIAAGSLLFRRLIDRSARPLLLLEAGLATLAVVGLATTLALPHLPGLLLAWMVTEGLGATRLLIAQIALSMLAMLPPTLILGGLFPLVTRLLARATSDAGDAVGKVYFATTLGSASGAFCTGFVLIPLLGLRDTLALGAIVNLTVTGILLLVTRRGRRGIAPALVPLGAAALLCVVPIPFDRMALTRGVFRSPESVLDFGLPFLPLEGISEHELLFYRDGLNSTVSVERQGPITMLRVNGKIDASDFGDMPTQVLLGQVPLLFGPPVKKALVIGYASGVTTGSVARHREVERIDAVEIEPAIVEASHFFDAQSGRPLDDPRVNLILDDARAYLSSTRERYDVIISEPSNPWMSGVSNLFTREFFHIARESLRPGGRLLQWVQLYAMPPEDLYSILAALRAEFGNVYAFSHGDEEPDLLLLATQEPLGRDDLPHWEKLPPAVKYDLRRIGNFSTADLWSLLRLLPADVDVLAKRAPLVNRDDNLHIELATPWLLGAMQGEDTLEPNWKAFGQFKLGVLPLLRQVGEPMDADRVGALALSYLRARHDPTVAAALLAVAAKGGGTPHVLAAALLLGRAFDTDNEMTMESQLQTIEQALTAAPDALEPLLIRADLHMEAEQYDLALADAEHASRIAPDDPRGLEIQARALRALGRDADALAAYVTLLGTSHATYYRTLPQERAELLLATDRPADAIPVLETYLREVRPGWQDGWLLLARAREQTGDAAAAKRARDNALVVEQNEIRRMHRQARISHWRGWDDVAIDLLQQVTTFEPGNAAAQAELAELRRANPSASPSGGSASTD